MTNEDFQKAVLTTRTLLESAQAVPAPIPAERMGDTPCDARHLSWMLSQCLKFSEEARSDKANRWLGYVQGVLAATGVAHLEELKRANMPEGAVYDPDRV